MNEPEETADATFRRLMVPYLAEPGVSTGTGFGSNPGVRVHGKIFAMVVRGNLVVKLPKSRVDELIASGIGQPFDTGRGRIMREWLTVPPGSGDWAGLIAEAREFVGGR